MTVCAPPYFCQLGECTDPTNVQPVAVQFLALSDWHGQLDPVGVGSPAVNYGGAPALSTYFANERAAFDGATLTLSVGDAFGASPPISAFFDEEPAIEAMNLMGFDCTIFGMLAPYQTALTAEFDEVIGLTTDVFVRGSNIERLQEVPLGDLVTDSMRDRYGTDFAITNGGGLRAPLPSSYLPADHSLRRTTGGYAAGPPYDLVKGDIFAVLPFGNLVVTRTVTEAQVWDMLENGVSYLPASNGRFAQVSGLKFSYNLNNQAGSKVVAVLDSDDNAAIPDDATEFTLATNDFMNTGGDGYTMLADGQGTPRDVMMDVLLDYVVAHTPIDPTVYPVAPNGRITNVTP